MHKHLYLIRGLCGSGKSTFAKTLAEAVGAGHFEADMYFYLYDDIYRYDASRIRDAHAWCKGVVAAKMELEYNVVVSNTFTTEKELKPYLDLAKEKDYTVTTLIVENRHGGVNIHGVPDDTLQKMRNRFSIKL